MFLIDLSSCRRFLWCAAVGVFLLGVSLHVSAVEIIGHRGGAWHDAPENTLPAFKIGYDQGADADELDVHLTKDGQVLVIHDGNTRSMTGVDAVVAEKTMEDLRAMDAGARMGKAWKDKGVKLPLLGEVLSLIPDGKRLFIEIKCGPEVLPELERVLKAAGKKPEQTVIIGFGYETMREAKAKLPGLAVYWILGWKKDKETGKWPTVEGMIAKAKAAGLDGLDLDYKFPIDAAFVKQVKEAGLKLYTWTVDDAWVAQKLVAAGVDGITTNRAGWMREQVK
jgi:glycerophosphoryl diester phosphodiesterase